MPEQAIKIRLEKFAAPLNPFEQRRLESYLRRSGMKKGAFARLAIIEKLDHEERIRSDAGKEASQ